MASLRITRTVTIITKVPVTADYYPSGNEGQGAMTPEEAVAYEHDQELVDKIEQFAEALSSAEFDLAVQPLYGRGKYAETIQIVDDAPSY